MDLKKLAQESQYQWTRCFASCPRVWEAAAGFAWTPPVWMPCSTEARDAISQGYGTKQDLGRIEEHGTMQGANPDAVPDFAKNRQQDEMGTFGSGNHYLEVQHVTVMYDAQIASALGIRKNDIVLSIHCGSRGLGHQIGTELKKMVLAPESQKIDPPDRELACAPIESPTGETYLGAMRAAMNCALANPRSSRTWPGRLLPRFYPRRS